MLGIYITAGYPNLESTKAALKVLDELGVDLIELGVPFSDPLADGPVIQEASHQALLNGTNLDKVFDVYQESGIKTKTILFSYYNALFAYGFDKVIQKCLETGIKGALIPDLPVEEAKELAVKFQANNLELILLAAVTSSDSRLKDIALNSKPWVYLVSSTGVTGSSSSKEYDLKLIVDKLRSYAPQNQIAIGFGIDSKEKIKKVFEQGADIAIVGTKAVRVLKEEGIEGFRKFICSLL
jgi:tryptophan synthase alpha chain